MAIIKNTTTIIAGKYVGEKVYLYIVCRVANKYDSGKQYGDSQKEWDHHMTQVSQPWIFIQNN